MANSRIDREVYAKFQQMSEVTGVPISACINNALRDWYDTVGTVQMDAVTAAVNGGRAILRQAVEQSKVLRFRAQAEREEASAVAEDTRTLIADSTRILSMS